MALINGTPNGETLTGTAEDDLIYAGGGHDTINAGAGADFIQLTDSGDAVVNGGDGNDIIQATSPTNGGPRFLTFYGDDGDDYIYLNDGGYGSTHYTVFGGAGSDIFVGQGARGAVIDAGSGDDNFTLRDGSYSMILGDGHDTVSVDNSSYLSQIATLRDFHVAGDSADRILFDRYLYYAITAHAGVNWDPTHNPFADGHARLIQSGDDSLLQLDIDAGGAMYGFFTFAVFENLTVSTLTATALGGYDPNGGAVVGMTLEGTDNADQLIGGAGADILNGGGGSDVLDGGYGDDVIHGGAGNDTIVESNGGSDQIFGDEGSDTISLDRSTVNAGDVLIDGGAGDDYLSVSSLRVPADSGTIVLKGGDGDDSISLGAGYNPFNLFGVTVDGGAGSDRISSGGGDDILIGGDNPPTNGPQTGFWPLGDSLSYSSSGGGVIVDLAITTQQDTVSAGRDTLSGFENLTGASFADVLGGNEVDNLLHGLEGNDVIAGRAGRDLLYGDEGNDLLEGGAGADYLDGGAGVDTASYTSATAAVTLDFVTNQHGGEAQGDTFFLVEGFKLSDFDDRFVGSQAAETVSGGAGNDWIEGGGGADRLDGGLGADTLIGGAGADLFLYYETDDSTTAQGGDVDQIADFQTGVDKIELHGGNGALAVELSSRDGAHTVLNAYAPGEAMEIHVTGQVAYSDLVFSGVAAQALTGGAGTDNLQGDGGWDVLTGGGGGDALTGGYGNDTFRYLAAGDSAPDAYDQITDFKTGVDVIDLKGVTPIEVSLVRSGTATFVFVNTPGGPMTIAANGDVNGSDIQTHDGHGVYMIGDGAANTLIGGATGDVIQAGAGDDVIIGGGGGDVLFGQAGADIFQYLAASDSNSTGSDGIYGFETGVDKIDLSALSPTEVSLIRSGGSTFLFANTPTGAMQLATVGYDLNAGDLVTGLSRGIFMVGDDTANTLVGGALNDVIQAGGGADVVRGGGGGDALWGGAGADVFKYTAASDSTSVKTDSIFDFQSGVDKLDLTGVHGGTSDIYGVLSSGGSTFVFVDLSGDGVSDMTIQLTNTASLQAGDILF